MTHDEEQFVQQMRTAALDAGAEPWEADWFAAIACHESDYGRAIPGGNNYIGYHWVDGPGWEWVEAREGMTGNRQRYRKFRDVVDSARSWIYLVHNSVAMPEYLAQRVLAGGNPQNRKAKIKIFSLGYCELDPMHGPGVYSIYKTIREEL